MPTQLGYLMAERDAKIKDRLVSIDAFRGVVMFLLIAEWSGLYSALAAPSLKGTLFGSIAAQFQHAPWRGLHLWDFGLPSFMFISGVAMALSYQKRWAQGESWAETLKHALFRSSALFLFGWLIYVVNPIEIDFPGAFLYDVLPQLALACLLAFLIMRRRPLIRISFGFGLLILTELLYRLWPVAGFERPFMPDQNFGSYVDQMLFGRLSPDHWVVFNAVPLAALTIWGTLAGDLLRAPDPSFRKIRKLALFGLFGTGAGLLLDPVTPVIRSVATSTFVIATGGFCLLALALAYFLIDIAGLRKPFKLFVVVGMNPIFIFLFTQSGGADWLHRIAKPFGNGLFGWASQRAGLAATSLIVMALLWGICYWLFRRKIFIRL